MDLYLHIWHPCSRIVGSVWLLVDLLYLRILVDVNWYKLQYILQLSTTHDAINVKHNSEHNDDRVETVLKAESSESCRRLSDYSTEAHRSKLAVGDNRLKDSLWGHSLFVTVNLWPLRCRPQEDDAVGGGQLGECRKIEGEWEEVKAAMWGSQTDEDDEQSVLTNNTAHYNIIMILITNLLMHVCSDQWNRWAKSMLTTCRWDLV